MIYNYLNFPLNSQLRWHTVQDQLWHMQGTYKKVAYLPSIEFMINTMAELILNLKRSSLQIYNKFLCTVPQFSFSSHFLQLLLLSSSNSSSRHGVYSNAISNWLYCRGVGTRGTLGQLPPSSFWSNKGRNMFPQIIYNCPPRFWYLLPSLT